MDDYHIFDSDTYFRVMALLFFLSLTNVEISFSNSELGFLVACIYLMLLALSWYKGFWKPRTGKVKYSIEELSYEAEEGDSYYFPPKPA